MLMGKAHYDNINASTVTLTDQMKIKTSFLRGEYVWTL